MKVSIVIPCYNEELHIADLLKAIDQQSLPAKEMEVIVADGLSTDGTRNELSRFAKEHPEMRIRIVDNPTRSIPAALNLAIETAQGEVIVRLDAHSIPDPDYVELSLDALREFGAANVGGIWRIKPSRPTWIARSIAAAGAHLAGRWFTPADKKDA